MSNIRNRAELLMTLLYSGIDEEELLDQASLSIEGITRLEKLIFLLIQEKNFLGDVNIDSKFNFSPFKMGPWSNQIYDEIDFLESLNLLKKKETIKNVPADNAYFDELLTNSIIDKYQKNKYTDDRKSNIFELSESGKKKALEIWNRLSPQEKKSIIDIKKRFNRMNLKQFLTYVYNKYPEYTTNSEIKDQLYL